jgi:hypothetical protein
MVDIGIARMLLDEAARKRSRGHRTAPGGATPFLSSLSRWPRIPAGVEARETGVQVEVRR